MKYIDRVETEVEQSIEAYMGSRVHETLEKLYLDLKYQKLNTLEELLAYLRDEWQKNWDDSIVIVKEEYSPENYLKMAEKFVTDYYNKHKPFDQGRTISLEERILINLDDSDNYKLQGYIDRVNESEEGYYEVHDYKTNSRLPLPEYIENDRQLALYAIGIKEHYPDVKNVKLIWHFLAFDKEIDSTRTDEELEELKRKTIELIDTIESDEKFEAKTSVLCNWCEFKPVCSKWSHLYKIREKPENEYMSDSGVQLVKRYAELRKKKTEMTKSLDEEIDKVEEALIEFAQNEGVDVVFGSHEKVSIKEYERFKFPSKHSAKRKELIEILKKYGKWEEVDQLDTSALNKIIQEKRWTEDVLDILKEYVELDKSKRLYVSKIKN
jgi:putative RecB family exonuclease